MMATALSEVLSEVKQSLNETLGERLVSVRVFGSYARGEGRTDSDIDVLVLVQKVDNYGDLIRCTSQSMADISLRHDVVLSRTFATAQDYRESQTPFFLNVRRESVPV